MNKEKIVFIVGSCKPVSSAVGSIALQYANFLKNNYEISIICFQQTINISSSFSQDDINFYPVTSKLEKNILLLNEKIKNNYGIKKKIFSIEKKILHFLRRIYSLFFVLDNTYWFKKSASKKFFEIFSDNKIKAIISFSSPIESHLAAKTIKKKTFIKWISYFGDSYLIKENKKNIFVTMNKMKNIEKRICFSSDYVLTTSEIFNEITKKYPFLNNKCEKMEYSLSVIRKKEKINEDNFDHKKINFLYAGTFYKKIRNPIYMLEVMKEVLEKCNGILHIFSNSECDSLIDDYVEKSSGKILHHNFIARELLHDLYFETDFLISCGNSNRVFYPSKSLEYISTGKPIINFFYETILDLEFDKYPLILNIQNFTNIESNVSIILNFILENNRKKIPIEKIKEVYNNNTLEYLKTKLLNVINSIEV